MSDQSTERIDDRLFLASLSASLAPEALLCISGAFRPGLMECVSNEDLDIRQGKVTAILNQDVLTFGRFLNQWATLSARKGGNRMTT